MSHSSSQSTPSAPREPSIGEIHADAIPIYIHEHVLEEAIEYSEGDLRRELGGFLIGSVVDDPPQRVEVRRFLPAEGALSEAGSLTFTHEVWSKMTREVERRYPHESIVGWHHTHPGFGVFLSGHDLFIHRNFFRPPWMVALVIDPRRRELGFFQWRGETIADCGFYCIAGEEETDNS